MADCHPDRPHLAKGLCSTCYESKRAKVRGNRWKDNDEGKRAECHPERRNFSKGLCKYCHHKKYVADNPEKKKTYYQRLRQNWLGYALKNKFGMTVREYEYLLKKQNGVCAICKKPEKGKRLSVDHHHGSGKTRGLLCQRCNTVIGMSLENERTLQSAIEYLRSYKE